METKPSLFKSVLPYGALTAIILMLYTAILINLQIQSGPLQWLAYLITAAALYYGVMKYRDTVLTGFISYGNAFKSSIVMLLIIAMMMGLFFLIYTSFDHSFVQQILDKARKGMEEKGNMTDEQIEMGMKMTKLFTTAPLMGLFTFIGYMFFGCLISLITSAIVKKDNPNPFAEFENTNA